VTIDRTLSWARRGFDHPSPWGESVPDDWADTEFHFYTNVVNPTPNAVGGLSGLDSEELVATLRGRAELVQASGVLVEAGAPLLRRYYNLFIALPLPDGQAMPNKGHRVWWDDALGRKVDVAVDIVDVPQNIVDHLEIRTEEVE
jgi:hypothetical protein